MDRFLSKKFFTALSSALLLVLVEGLGLDLPADAIQSFVIIILGYLFAQAGVDITATIKNGK